MAGSKHDLRSDFNLQDIINPYYRLLNNVHTLHLK